MDKAKKLLVNLSNEKQLNSLTAEVRAKPEHHKFLIGRQGKIYANPKYSVLIRLMGEGRLPLQKHKKPPIISFFALIFIGANIQSVRDKTGARIIFPNEKDKDREVITILGTKEAVAQAKIELESRIKDLVSSDGVFLIL